MHRYEGRAIGTLNPSQMEANMALLEAMFETRREAEMSIERLVQEFGLDRKAIKVVADGTLNSA